MQDLGMTVLRTWAFNDASDNTTWMPLQTEPGKFSEAVFRSFCTQLPSVFETLRGEWDANKKLPLAIFAAGLC